MNIAARILALATSGVLLLAGLVLGARSLQSPAPAAAPARVLKITTPRPQWRHDLALSQAEARAERRFVLISFTGSDWCGWSLRLRREVFTKPEFVAYAESNLVLIELDFPRENRQSARQQATNRDAARRLGVSRVPTVVLLDSDGRTLRKWGFEDGGARHYLAQFRKAIAESEIEPTLSETNAARTSETTSEKPHRETAAQGATTGKVSPRESGRAERPGRI